MKRYDFNDHFFDVIDSSSKAYILGFLFADGYNYERRGVVTISLQEKDKEILEKISIELNSNKPLQFIDMLKYYKKSTVQNQYRLNFSSRHMSQTLANLGCVQRKSYICQFPEIPVELHSHFIRGYFDGDGCISYTLNRTGRLCGSVSFVGSLHVCQNIKNILESLNISSSIYTSNRYDNRLRILKFGGRKQLDCFYKFIYKEANVFLQRKKLKFETFLRKTENTKNYTNVYSNTKGSTLPFRVVKTLNYKSIHIGSFKSRYEGELASAEWDRLHGRSIIQ